jgi:hypothetical protein
MVTARVRADRDSELLQRGQLEARQLPPPRARRARRNRRRRRQRQQHSDEGSLWVLVVVDAVDGL